MWPWYIILSLVLAGISIVGVIVGIILHFTTSVSTTPTPLTQQKVHLPAVIPADDVEPVNVPEPRETQVQPISQTVTFRVPTTHQQTDYQRWNKRSAHLDIDTARVSLVGDPSQFPFALTQNTTFHPLDRETDFLYMGAHVNTSDSAWQLWYTHQIYDITPRLIAVSLCDHQTGSYQNGQLVENIDEEGAMREILEKHGYHMIYSHNQFSVYHQEG